MNHFKCVVPLLLLPLVRPTLAIAEDIIVTASRYETPVTQTLSAVTVLTEQDLKHYQDDQLGTLLNRLSGVHQVSYGSLGSVSSALFRGTTSSQVLVLIDGVPIVSASTGQSSLSSIPLSNIERIEVVRGPVSSLYGANAIGGVIQVFTKSAETGSDDVYVSVSLGSFNFRRLGTGFMLSSEKTQAAADIYYTGTDGFDSTTLDSYSNQDKDGFTQYSGSVSVDTRLTDNLLLGIKHLQSSSKADYDSSFCADPCAEQPDWQTQAELTASSLSLNYDLSTEVQLRTRLGRYVDDSVNTDSVASTDDSQFKTTGLTANALAERTLGNMTAIVGIDVENVELDSTADYEETDRLNAGVFTSLATYSGDIGLNASLRFDYNSSYDTYTTGTLGASYLITDSLEVIGTAGTAFRAPSFNELYFPNYGNEDVKPEESQSIELALRQFTRQGEWRVSAYRIETRNLIGYDATTFSAGNVAEARILGLEFDANQRLGAFEFTFNTSVTEARDGDEERLNNRPQWTVFAGAGYRYGAWLFNTDLQAESGRQNGDVALGDVALLGVGTQFSLTNDSFLSARVDNLLDEEYFTNYNTADFYYNTPGRTFKVSAEYHF